MARIELKIASVPCAGADPDNLLSVPIPVTIHRQFIPDTEWVDSPKVEVACPYIRKFSERSGVNIPEASFCLAGVNDNLRNVLQDSFQLLEDPNIQNRSFIVALGNLQRNLPRCIQKNPV